MWQLKIQDPSGEKRTIPLQSSHRGSLTLGRDPKQSEIWLKDPTLPNQALTLWATPAQGDSPYWFRCLEGVPSIQLGDLKVREGQFPSGISLLLGESELTLEKEKKDLVPLPIQPSHLPPWLTASDEGQQILWLAKKAAATPLSIYLAGETGTGKEVLAHLLHAWSERASGPFVALNCGALPLSLAESELFGHAKGAFTGAIHQRSGALLQAHNGTLFLDEIAELSPDIQVKLLRFLENGEIRPVGADHACRADVRLLCATHQGLKKLVKEGKFRQDLYFRIASITIEIPPLKSRPEDIALLANRFVKEFGKKLSAKAVTRLQAYSWPGNVRELRHAIERACGISGPFTEILGADAFDFLLTQDEENTGSFHTPGSTEPGIPVLCLKEMERLLILKALRISRGNRRTAAKHLGVARSTLFEMLKRHGIPGPKSKSFQDRKL